MDFTIRQMIISNCSDVDHAHPDFINEHQNDLTDGPEIPAKTVSGRPVRSVAYTFVEDVK